MTDHTRAMLEEAWVAIHGNDLRLYLCTPDADPNSPPERHDYFTRLLDLEAYLDAAVMLVPEGWNACIWTTGAATLRHPVNPMKDIPANAETPALALLAAIMKAKNDE